MWGLRIKYAVLLMAFHNCNPPPTTCSLYEDQSYQLPEEKRRAIIELGLPDDGYDYLQHLRSTAPAKGGSVKPVREPASQEHQEVRCMCGWV